MKIIKIIILLAIIAISIQAESLRIKSKNKKSKAVSRKSNTFTNNKAKQTPCSVGSFDVRITIDGDDAGAFSGVFDAREVKTPLGESLKGWKFTITTVSPAGKKVFYDTGFGSFIAYRQLSIPFTSSSPVGVGKIITTTLQSSATEIHSIKIQFAYDSNWEVIDDKDLENIVSWLNINRSNKIDYIKDLKNKEIAAAEDYALNKSSANFNGNTVEDINKQVAKLNADIAKLDASTTLTTTNLEANEKLITSQQQKIDTLKSLQKSYDTTLLTLAGTKISQESSLAKFNKDKFDNNTDQSRYKDAYDGAFSKINGLIATYKPECANMGVFLETALKNLTGEKSTINYLINVKKALATSG